MIWLEQSKEAFDVAIIDFPDPNNFSLGVWGFALAKLTPFNAPSSAPAGLKFLDDATMAGMFVLPIDLAPVEVQVNRLDNQALVHYYETELRRLR